MLGLTGLSACRSRGSQERFILQKEPCRCLWMNLCARGDDSPTIETAAFHGLRPVQISKGFSIREETVPLVPLTRILLVLLSVAFFVCSLPGPDIGWLGWVALVPILLACEGLPALGACGLGLAFGIVSSFGIYGWLFEVNAFDLRHAVVLALYVAIYPAVWCTAIAWLERRHVPFIVTAPALWVIIDYLRAHAGFLALPWGTLAQTQHHNLPILQIASLGGEQAVTFLVAVGNAALASVILRREQKTVVMAVIALAVVHLWGAAVVYTTPQGPGIKVTAIQPNIQIAERQTGEGRAANLERLEQLTHRAASDHPVLIVWPESAIPGDLNTDPSLVARLQGLSDEIGIPLIIGAARVEKFATGMTDIRIGRRVFNTAYLLRPRQPVAEPYRKRVLVPFAEYLPYADLIPWPEWLAPRVAEMTQGDRNQLFRVLPDLTVGTLICWENLFAPLARESVRGGGNLIVQLTNDVWFGRSAASRQHNLMSVMRAVENRVPIVIASNTGPSQIIDGYGRVVAKVPNLFTEGLATETVNAGIGGTLYSAVGDFFVFCALAGLGAFYAWRSASGTEQETSAVGLAAKRLGAELVCRRVL